MSKDNNIIPSGPFKGKKIEMAPMDGVDMFQSLAEEFMEAIFGMKPGSYLITDESNLRDFKGIGDLELVDTHCKIRRVYGVGVSNIQSGNLVEIFTRIHRHTYGPAQA